MMKAVLRHIRRPELINSIDYTCYIVNRVCKRNFYLDNYRALLNDYSQLQIFDILGNKK